MAEVIFNQLSFQAAIKLKPEDEFQMWSLTDMFNAATSSCLQYGAVLNLTMERCVLPEENIQMTCAQAASAIQTKFEADVIDFSFVDGGEEKLSRMLIDCHTAGLPFGLSCEGSSGAVRGGGTCLDANVSKCGHTATEPDDWPYFLGGERCIWTPGCKQEKILSAADEIELGGPWEVQCTDGAY